jgi:hypothetical protein
MNDVRDVIMDIPNDGPLADQALSIPTAEGESAPTQPSAKHPDCLLNVLRKRRMNRLLELSCLVVRSILQQHMHESTDGWTIPPNSAATNADGFNATEENCLRAAAPAPTSATTGANAVTLNRRRKSRPRV